MENNMKKIVYSFITIMSISISAMDENPNQISLGNGIDLRRPIAPLPDSPPSTREFEQDELAALRLQRSRERSLQFQQMLMFLAQRQDPNAGDESDPEVPSEDLLLQ
jgi:hypothetical protein